MVKSPYNNIDAIFIIVIYNFIANFSILIGLYTATLSIQ